MAVRSRAGVSQRSIAEGAPVLSGLLNSRDSLRAALSYEDHITHSILPREWPLE